MKIDISDGIKLTVDYSKTVEQAIADCKCDLNSRDIIIKNFPISPEMIGNKADITNRLFHFNRHIRSERISSENIIEEMDSWFCRPATLMELLALGATHPELQREFRVVALGSIWRDSRGICLVPFLGVHGVMRKSYLNPFDCDWDAGFRFLGIRK